MRVSFLALPLLSLAFLSQFAAAAVPPLSQDQREHLATSIVTGQVVSIESEIEELSYGKNAIHTVVLQSDNGEYLSFQYWQALERPIRWAGPNGQYHQAQIGDHVRAYLRLDEETGIFKLLTPNGLDQI